MYFLSKSTLIPYRHVIWGSLITDYEFLSIILRTSYYILRVSYYNLQRFTVYFISKCAFINYCHVIWGTPITNYEFLTIFYELLIQFTNFLSQFTKVYSVLYIKMCFYQLLPCDLGQSYYRLRVSYTDYKGLQCIFYQNVLLSFSSYNNFLLCLFYWN